MTGAITTPCHPERSEGSPDVVHHFSPEANRSRHQTKKLRSERATGKISVFIKLREFGPCVSLPACREGCPKDRVGQVSKKTTAEIGITNSAKPGLVVGRAESCQTTEKSLVAGSLKVAPSPAAMRGKRNCKFRSAPVRIANSTQLRTNPGNPRQTSQGTQKSPRDFSNCVSAALREEFSSVSGQTNWKSSDHG